MSTGYIPVVVVMMHHYDHEAGRPTMTMRLVWCGAGWFGVTWRVVVCCGAAWCGVVLFGVVGWVSTLGVYCGFLLYDDSAGIMVISFHVSFSCVCTSALSRATQAPPAQSTHSSSSPESSDAADPTPPLIKAADTATQALTPH